MGAVLTGLTTMVNTIFGVDEAAHPVQHRNRNIDPFFSREASEENLRSASENVNDSFNIVSDEVDQMKPIIGDLNFYVAKANRPHAEFTVTIDAMEARRKNAQRNLDRVEVQLTRMKHHENKIYRNS